MQKIKDKLILGLVVGLLADIPKNLLCLTLFKADITTRKCSDLAASVFIPTYKVFSKKGTLFGILCDFVVGSLSGIATVYLITSTGKVTKKNALIKGLLSGLVSFGIFRGLFIKVGTSKCPKAYPKDMLTNITMSITSSVWGITAGLLTLLLGDKDLLEAKPCVPSNPSDKIQPSLKLS
ncbi:hypothetical protein [Desulfosporosinus youngiae]|uniref:Uncharacterized protein n=1 Tax=Desulfosporosinus youngiae DSM 17734 TaxID=768710 RepID=H5XXE6_9FIRM|nr:hypothetical protein [Desulfosporosinus youngiae]EHQ91152.1 hypothetical protein DesyoDRAFT_4193 [Desulfosporosinus youngiae DSM 17734]